MKKFILFLAKIALCFVLLFSLIVSLLLFFPANVYASSYQGVIQKKFDYLKNTEEKKIILIGGSNLSFGIDEEKIEEATGYAVANLGLHAGFGSVIPTELAKVNIGQGDIVLLAYEWGWHSNGYFDIFGTDLVMSGFDDRLDMYKLLPAEHYSKLLGYLGDNFKKKLSYTPATGLYSAESFDENGRMILDRPGTWMAYEGNEDTYGRINLGDGNISQHSLDYLKDFKAFVEEKGAKVYFVAPPVYEGAVVSEAEIFSALLQQADEKLGIPYISNPQDYFFPNDYIFDTPYHCTSIGEAHRTQLLIQDLQKVLP